MARFRGGFEISANYEPLKAAPFDARALVESKADLILPATWQDSNGDIWIYAGMIVSVASDIDDANNGLYRLLSATRYQEESAWEKLADATDLEALKRELQEQIDNIEVSGGGSLDVEVTTVADLPAIGDSNTTYYVKENASIQRWDATDQEYNSYGGGVADLDINLIYGGNSNG